MRQVKQVLTQHTNFSPNIDRQTCCSMPRTRMLETHAQCGHDTTSISSIRPASAASADTPRPASAASQKACFSFGRLKSHLPKRTEIWPKTNRFCPAPDGIAEKTHQFAPPPLITPSSLCEVMNEAPSRGAFVIYSSGSNFHLTWVYGI